MANDRCQCCTKKTLNRASNIHPGSLGSFANKYIEQKCQSEAL